MKDLLLIIGATATGKSDFGLLVAQAFNGEIINGDMGQLYSPVPLGTAAPLLEEGAPAHHLYGCMTDPVSLNAGAYRALCLEKVADIKRRGKLPIIVGGSSFYMSSLFFPPQDLAITGKAHDYIHVSADALWQKLHELDPQRALQLHPHDRYRVERALTLWDVHGMLPSQCEPQYQSPGNCLVISVERTKDDLHARIEQRADIMLRSGLIEEAQNLPQEWKDFVVEKGLIGYKEVYEYVNKSLSLRESLITRTKQYAKRQICFNKKLCLTLKAKHDIEILHANLTLYPPTLYLETLQHSL